MISLGLSLLFIAPLPKPEITKEQHFPEPLELVINDKFYTLYGGNELNKQIRQICLPYFSFVEPNRLNHSKFEECFAKENIVPLAESGLIGYLENLKRATIVIPRSTIESQVAIVKALFEGGKPQFETKSTKDKDGLVAPLSKSEIRYFEIDYSLNYRSVYGAPPAKIPDSLKDVETYFIPDLYHFKNTSSIDKGAAPIHRFISQDQHGKQLVYYLPFATDEAWYTNDVIHYQGALALNNHFEKQMSLAAPILAKYHPELSTRQHKMLLQIKLFNQMSSLAYEDPWQDINACKWSNSKYADDFEKAFQGVSHGIKIGSRTWTPPGWVWQAASKLHTSIEEQGFGPYQLIFGLLKEASQDTEIRAHFAAYLSPEDFVDDKAIMRTIFEKPTMSCAMAFDHILTQLEKTSFVNPEVRCSPIYPPFIMDKTYAREYALMFMAVSMLGFPEKAEHSEHLIFYGAHFLSQWDFYSEVLGQPYLFPELPRWRRLNGLKSGGNILTYTLDYSSN